MEVLDVCICIIRLISSSLLTGKEIQSNLVCCVQVLLSNNLNVIISRIRQTLRDLIKGLTLEK